MTRPNSRYNIKTSAHLVEINPVTELTIRTDLRERATRENLKQNNGGSRKNLPSLTASLADRDGVSGGGKRRERGRMDDGVRMGRRKGEITFRFSGENLEPLTVKM